MKDTDRSVRRFHRERMKKKAEVVVCKWGGNQNPGKFADNLAKCSCAMCGNPRRWFNKRTIQELKCDVLNMECV